MKKGNAMSSLISTVLILLFFFYLVVSVIAGKGGEPTSCYKWSYNHLDGYVADNVNYDVSNYILKKRDTFYEGRQTTSPNEKKNLRSQLQTQFVFRYERSCDKALPAE